MVRNGKFMEYYIIKETVSLLQSTLLKKWQFYGVLDYQRSGKFMVYLIIQEMVSLWCI